MLAFALLVVVGTLLSIRWLQVWYYSSEMLGSLTNAELLRCEERLSELATEAELDALIRGKSGMLPAGRLPFSGAKALGRKDTRSAYKILESLLPDPSLRDYGIYGLSHAPGYDQRKLFDSSQGDPKRLWAVALCQMQAERTDTLKLLAAYYEEHLAHRPASNHQRASVARYLVANGVRSRSARAE